MFINTRSINIKNSTINTFEKWPKVNEWTLLRVSLFRSAASAESPTPNHAIVVAFSFSTQKITTWKQANLSSKNWKNKPKYRLFLDSLTYLRGTLNSIWKWRKFDSKFKSTYLTLWSPLGITWHIIEIFSAQHLKKSCVHKRLSCKEVTTTKYTANNQKVGQDVLLMFSKRMHFFFDAANCCSTF